VYACLHAAGNPALLVECARQFSPHIEEISDDTVLLDIRGLGRMFMGSEEIAAALVNRAGLAVDVAIASDADAAVFAARGIRGITVIPPGREADVLAPLTLNLLPGSPETAGILNAWGIRTFGEFAALPPLGVAARLGSEGTYLQNLALGQGGRQLNPIESPLQFEEELELDDPVELLEPLAFLLSRLLNNLCARLISRALATDQVQLSLTLENAAPHECVLRLPVPMRDSKTLLKLLQLELDARPPVAPVLKIRLLLKPVKPRTQQHGLFLARSPEPAKLEITLARLCNLLGAENVGTPALLDTHRPDAFRMNRFAPCRVQAEAPLPTSATLVLRRYRPPQHAQVLIRDEKPVHVAAAPARGKVVECVGPWRTSGAWWLRDAWDQDEWDVALSDGALYRIHEDRRTGRWFLEGSYD